MRTLLFIFVLFFQTFLMAELTDQRYDGSYQIGKNTWCNGPSGGVAGCWFYGWQRVDTSKLTEVKIETLQSVHYFTITDKSGNTWYSNFVVCSECQKTACNAQQSETSLTVHFGDTNNSLKVVIEENEISLFIWAEAQHAYLIFDYTKN